MYQTNKSGEKNIKPASLTQLNSDSLLTFQSFTFHRIDNGTWMKHDVLTLLCHFWIPVKRVRFP